MRISGVLDPLYSQPVPYFSMPWLHSVITAMPSSGWEHRRSTSTSDADLAVAPYTTDAPGGTAEE
jgi:hypothetical protein